jgi:3-deoxy-7-phosphoheptulonate synthase
MNRLYMLGPCSIDSEERLIATASLLKEHGVQVLRGGTYKMRTNPESWQGMGEDGLRLLTSVAREYNLQSLTEITDLRHLDLYLKYGVDILQIGSRNMFNYPLLQELGGCGVPLLLKRHFAASLDEFLHASAYLDQAPQLFLCERGIRSHDTHFRFTFDINAIAWLKQHSGRQVIADPSHGTGEREYVTQIAGAAIAAGADGIQVEVHPEPEDARSDARQSLDLSEAEKLVTHCETLAGTLDKMKS